MEQIDSKLICKLVGNEVIQVAEHPLTLDESKATVTYVTEKLSDEAFDGAKVRLMNAKNILLTDVDGTRGKARLSSVCMDCLQNAVKDLYFGGH